MKSIRILGSCVTRDALDIPSSDFKLIDYTARTSLASLSTKSRKDSTILNNIKSTFQKRMVERDMTKRFWKSIENIENDIIIIDLIDDRFNLRLFDDNSSHTISSEYNKASINLNQNGRLIKSSSNEFKILWEEGLNRFKDICNAQKLSQIFVNCVFYQPTGDKAIDIAAKITENNEYLKSAYSKLKNKFGAEAMIEYPEEIINADINHKWGLAPFHFTEQTYEYLISELKNRTK